MRKGADEGVHLICYGVSTPFGDLYSLWIEHSRHGLRGALLQAGVGVLLDVAHMLADGDNREVADLNPSLPLGEHSELWPAERDLLPRSHRFGYGSLYA